MTTRLLPASILAAGALTVLALAIPAAGGFGALLEAGTITHVEVAQASDVGVVAGKVTVQTQGPFGLPVGGDTVAPDGGWVVLHVKGDRLLGDGPLTVTDEMPFEDPNGGTWLAREVQGADGAVGWVVPVGEVHHDPTIDRAYNFAAIVDWSQVPEDGELTVSYHRSLPLDTGEGARQG